MMQLTARVFNNLKICTCVLGLLLLCPTRSIGQIGIGTTPHSSAALDLQDGNRGFLPPRMSSSQRDLMPSPVAGLMIWCNDFGELQVFNGVAWTNLLGHETTSAALAIGDSYRGGIIAYILQSGDPGYDPQVFHGIIAAHADVTPSAQWGCYGMPVTPTSTLIGSGESNTNEILDDCIQVGIAARLCDMYENGVFNDWYLPSIDELEKLFVNKVVIGGFIANGIYWSSSAWTILNAWAYLFIETGAATNQFEKDSPFAVRPIRRF